MGQELRSIVLSDEEFIFATGLYFDSQRETAIKSSNIKALRGPAEADGQAVVDFKVPLVDGKSSITIERRELIDIFVCFCKNKAIPLPKSGRKSVLRRDGNLVLEIELDWF